MCQKEKHCKSMYIISGNEKGMCSTCMKRNRNIGCWRCSQRKIGCSIVEARKKGKGKEAEVVGVKRTEKRGEETELGELKEILKKMVKAMEQVADGIENLVEGQEELIKQQRSTGLGVEKLLRVLEGKDQKREEERKAEEAVEDEEKTDSESETEETAAGEKDGDGCQGTPLPTYFSHGISQP